MLQLCFGAGLVIIISALCSLCEAALYSLTISHIEITGQGHKRIGRILMGLKKDIHRPITAILTMNTIANTAGATIVGVAAAGVFGAHNVVWFSVVFTVAILLFSEILPKTIGVSYCRELALWIAYPLRWMVKLMTPFILVIQAITRLLPAKDDGLLVSAQEIQALARQSHKSGEISLQERRVITNILDLKAKNVRQIMTPLTVTFMLEANLTVTEAMQSNEMLNMHSRIPIYEKNRDEVVGIILRKDLFSWATQGAGEKTLREFMQPVHFVPETGRLTTVMLEFFEHHKHLFMVVDEYGSVTGVVSLEDIIEEIVGREIIDESDLATDMRELAKRKRLSFMSQSQSKNNSQIE
ncbi:hemolysin family protein [Thiovibrio frasassiensis]|uniref:Hemolysin family protein n=1 Tax=Thiovibrio frasassiensis TaxID=2984131 RepID=A0A9X4MI86_9BACT|nr:hemolysin family protein [Thiovibrio frasassiensis]MDG4476838.1 hemolysin family protein [Thiovibrio frasassiensis]